MPESWEGMQEATFDLICITKYPKKSFDLWKTPNLAPRFEPPANTDDLLDLMFEGRG